MDDRIHITLPCAILSLLLSIISLWFGIAIFKKPNIDDAGKDNKMQYYERTSRISTAGNVWASLAVTVYCVWVMFEPEHTTLWFIIFRGIPTLAWFTSKASLIWFYNGLLYYTFKSGLVETSRCSFIAANIIICAGALLCIVCGYSGLWYGIDMLISIGFEGFSILYLICSTYLCFGFVHKMLLLYAYEQQSEIATTTTTTTTNNKEEAQKSMVPDQTSFFLHVATKKTIFMTCISISACFVAASRLIYEYAMAPNHINLMLPMLVFSVDANVSSCCIYMFSKFGDPVYEKWCFDLMVCCKRVMHSVSKSYLDERDHRDDHGNGKSDVAARTQTVTIEVGNRMHQTTSHDVAADGEMHMDATVSNGDSAEDGNVKAAIESGKLQKSS
eukprot:CAMPEP_0202729864 /NCGR_PEP_ID=MMETSP1385-20130828/186351_1 /ASSEMBLY_ACC=CAM_ASM_000861 /TAXON_ID=933848 /ORGANISM="Elphidium margaritaceum" /LENGTH=386 /DNA_ID=CAMNT_0049396135 /DNA_START=62 /DNA_END=1222 /DNA_ORIENTATION=+